MTKPKDSFYTPIELADKLVSLIIEDGIKTVMDFCVGNGDLLKAVQRKFPEVECFGTDIATEAIERLRESQPAWILEVCDFSSTERFDQLSVFGYKRYDLIVLNPPFTCKGSSICKIIFEDIAYNVSTAMMFVTNALKYRADNGVLYAILPSSCAYSQKDRKLWEDLMKKYNLQILATPDRMYWQDCAASIILVSIGGKENRTHIEKPLFDFTSLPVNKIVRGHISPHDAHFVDGRKGVKYIHTTNLQNNKIVNCSCVGLPEMRDVERYGRVCIQGPAVLIPRVCKPNIGKVCVYKYKSVFVPSDCVIALCTKSYEDASLIAYTLREHWEQFRTIYQGTAAKYTTMERVRKLFDKA